MMTTQLETLTDIERLQLYLDYLENRKKYSPEDRKELDKFFEDG